MVIPPQEIKFAADNIRDGILDDTLLLWPAYDIQEGREVWIIGRKVKDKVLPVAVLLESLRAVKRYAPRTGEREDYDFSQIESKIIRP